jgi:hypothetical protein
VIFFTHVGGKQKFIGGFSVKAAAFTEIMKRKKGHLVTKKLWCMEDLRCIPDHTYVQILVLLDLLETGLFGCLYSSQAKH